ncbi:MAG: sulfatase-like hydrolase/transferase [Candidatus Lokiarchaeota archaeon]|nr:sulfatase-like hydrolase/transferase [Candidatus Lokiarchaeota archaeon]
MARQGQPNILLIFPDQHRGDWMPYPDDVIAKFGMQRLPLRMPVIEGLMARGATFYNCITPSPLCAPARSCLASGLRYEKTGVKSNGYNHPIEIKTFYKVLKENGYVVGGCGKFDLRKAEHFFAGTGWVPKMASLGFSEGFSIDNGGKHDAIRCGTTHVDPADGKRKRHADPTKAPPNCPYMKYLNDNDLMMVHVNDFKRRATKYLGLPLDSSPTLLPDEAYCDNWVTRNALDIVNRFPADKPWFLQVNFVCPHEPWDVTRRMRDAWKDVTFPGPNHGSKLAAGAEKKVRQNYAAMIENIDRNAGLIIDAVAQRGELDNTIVVYSSDHGEMLGDFMKYGKSRPERGSIRVPLVMAGPGIKKGVTSSALVELQDLAATFMDYAGLSMPEAADSVSLRPVLEGRIERHRDHVASALARTGTLLGDKKVGWRSVLDGKYKLVVNTSGKEALFDIEADPWENVDVSSRHPEEVERLKDLLD